MDRAEMITSTIFKVYEGMNKNLENSGLATISYDFFDMLEGENYMELLVAARKGKDALLLKVCDIVEGELGNIISVPG